MNGHQTPRLLTAAELVSVALSLANGCFENKPL